ncbi:MAG: hypothetical protein GY801_39300 [bacterium]|nr:hypothetical protein [bacterium]
MSNSNTIVKKIWEDYSILVVYIVLFTCLSLFVPYFFSWINMMGVALSVSMVGIVACTMLLCLASGHFDLSVESVVAFSGILAAVMINKTDSSSD